MNNAPLTKTEGVVLTIVCNPPHPVSTLKVVVGHVARHGPIRGSDDFISHRFVGLVVVVKSTHKQGGKCRYSYSLHLDP